MKKLFSFFLRLTFVVFVVLLCVSFFLNLYTRSSLKKIENGQFVHSGYACAIVNSGSMETTIFTNDLIVLKGVSSYEKGEIATYVSERGSLITHRVVEVSDNGYVMQGDANNTSDGEISRQRFMGRVVLVIPAVGILINGLSSPVGLLFLVIFLVGFFLMLELTRERKQEAAYQHEN